MTISCTPWNNTKTSWNRLSIVQRHKSRGIKTWYLRENAEGCIRYRSLGTTHKTVAEQCLQRLLVQRFVLPWEKTVPQDMDSLIDKFVARPTLKSNSADQYRRILTHFSNWCKDFGVSDILQIGTKEAQEYYLGLSEKSARQRCHVCGIFLSWVYKCNEINKTQPFKLIEYRKTVRLVRDSWSPEEVQKIVESAPNRNIRMLWALMAYAGLRISEANNLTDNDIRGNTLIVIGKGDKYATLPIGNKLAAELSLHGPLNEGLHISKQKSIRELCKVCKSLHIEGWASNHKFRHSFASNLAIRGCPVGIAMRLMRHSSSAMTLDVYTHVLQNDMIKWVD